MLKQNVVVRYLMHLQFDFLSYM